MEAPVGFQDWELLQSSEMAVATPPPPPPPPPPDDDGGEGFDGEEGEDSDNGIRPDYFSLDSNKRYGETRVHEDEGLAGSENRSWIDPNSVSWYSGKGIREMGLGGIQLEGLGCSWTSDGSPDFRRSLPFGGLVGFANKYEVNLFDGLGGGGGGGGVEEIREEGTFGRGEEDGGEGVEAAENDSYEGLGSDDGKERDGDELVERKSGSSSSSEIGSEGKKSGTVWWKLPLQFFKFYASKVSPIWSISIAAAVMGFIVLGQKFYRMKKKSGSFPIKFSTDEKKASQFMARAMQLNEAFSVVKRIPVIRTSLPTPAAALRFAVY